MSKNFNEFVANYQKLQAEDKRLEVAIKFNPGSFDAHTVENRDRCNDLIANVDYHN